MPLDINHLGFIIGVVALGLAIPLAIIANLLTPKVNNWWSTRSQVRLNIRIQEQESEIRANESTWLFTDAERSIYRQIRAAQRTVALFVHVLLGALIILLPIFRRDIQDHVSNLTSTIVPGITIILLIGMFGNWLNAFSFRDSLRTWRANTQMGRNEVKQELENLRLRLR